MNCSEVLNGLMLEGITNTYSFFMTTFRQYEIEYDSMPKDRESLLVALRDERYATLSDTIIVLILPVLAVVHADVSNSIISFF